MALKDIIARIEAEARAQGEQIVADAEARASEIVGEGQRKALQQANSIVSDAEKKAQTQAGHILTLARLQGRREVLEAKQEALNEAFQSALERLSQLDDDTYLQLIKQVVSVYAVRGTEEIVVNAHDRQRITQDFLKGLNQELKEQGLEGTVGLSSDSVDITGGCILRGEDLEVNASFDAILKTLREDLEPEIAGHLFGNRS